MSDPIFRIDVGDVTRPAIIALLEEHLAHMRAITPPDQVFALDVGKLQAPDITFWSVWQDGVPSGGALVGCGALKALSAHEGEVKSMRTPSAMRRQGAGRVVLDRVVTEARRRGYTQLYLETGSQPDFYPAHALYRSVGFVDCGPFADYLESPWSVFMVLHLR